MKNVFKNWLNTAYRQDGDVFDMQITGDSDSKDAYGRREVCPNIVKRAILPQSKQPPVRHQ